MKQRRFHTAVFVTILGLIAVGGRAWAQQSSASQSETTRKDAVVSDSKNFLARLWRAKRTGSSLLPANRVYVTQPSGAAWSPAVHGSGTVGKIALWVETLPNGESRLGDSIITQLNGNIGIGLAGPLSKLAVQGMIETTMGGYKFPDGTVQTTAAVSGLQAVIHDASLTGDGTAGSPLGVALPLVLKGPTPGCCIEDRVLTLWNTSEGQHGMVVIAGGSPGSTRRGGTGAFVTGGISSTDDGGTGVDTRGGGSASGRGGEGVTAHGGSSDSGTGGAAFNGFGGTSNTGEGGVGVITGGGHSNNGPGGLGLVVGGGGSIDGPGGAGILTNGGSSLGGGVGGNGVVATGGNFNGRGVFATGGIGPVGYGVEARGGNSTGSGGVAGAGIKTMGGASSGSNSASGTGIFAIAGEATNNATRGRAGIFEGDVSVSELLTASSLDVTGTKNFKIDHPLDPENKYLLHAAIESSEVLNIYSGNIVTDAKGEAVVTLPEWFEVLNRDLRYQLTVVGTFAQAIVNEKVKHNRFTIKTNIPSVEVSWQVTGVRSDAVMQRHPFKAEMNKSDRERGSYLSPELFGKPDERGVEWARVPEIMQQLKQQRIETGQTTKRQPDQR